MARTKINRWPMKSHSVLCIGVNTGDPATDALASIQQIQFPYIGINPSADPFTVLTWVKPLNIGKGLGWYDMQVLSQNNGTGTGRTWMGFALNTAEPLTGRWSSGLGSASGNSYMKARSDHWQCGGFSYNAATKIQQFYFNGQPAFAKTAVTAESATGGLNYGATKNNTPSTYGVRGFNGYLSVILVFRQILTPAEVLDCVEHGNYSRTNLVLECLFNESSGSVIDTSGNGFNGVLVNGATWSTTEGAFLPRETINRSQITRSQI